MDKENKGGPEVKTLIKTENSWDGSPLPAYPLEKPEIIIDRIRFPPHHATEWHYHSVINAGVVISGALTIVCRDGKEKTFHAGDPLVECVGVVHRGENRGDIPVDIIMFYDTTPGLPIETKVPNP